MAPMRHGLVKPHVQTLKNLVDLPPLFRINTGTQVGRYIDLSTSLERTFSTPDISLRQGTDDITSKVHQSYH